MYSKAQKREDVSIDAALSKVMTSPISILGGHPARSLVSRRCQGATALPLP